MFALLLSYFNSTLLIILKTDALDSYYIPKPSYTDSVSQSFTNLAIALIKSDKCLDIIYLRSKSQRSTVTG
jgi:hypothetical protein